MQILLLNIIVTVSGFYLTRVTSVSPIYIFFGTCMCLYIVFLFNGRKIVINPILAMSLILFSYLAISQYVINEEVIDHTTIDVLFSLVYFMLVSQIIFNIGFAEIVKACHYFLNFSLILLLVDTIWRLSHPSYAQVIGESLPTNLMFYKYKTNSLMYQDSNFVGSFVVCLNFFTLYLHKTCKRRYTLQTILLFILTVLTFSRASIITTLLCYPIMAVKGLRKGLQTFLMVASAFILTVIYVVEESFLTAGSSYSSKVNILQMTIAQLHTNFSRYVFGVGLGNVANYLGIGPHNYIVANLLGTGIIGFALLALLWCLILMRTHCKAAYVMLPFLINGFALAGDAIPFLYVMFAVIVRFNEIERQYSYYSEGISINYNSPILRSC